MPTMQEELNKPDGDKKYSILICKINNVPWEEHSATGNGPITRHHPLFHFCDLGGTEFFQFLTSFGMLSPTMADEFVPGDVFNLKLCNEYFSLVLCGRCFSPSCPSIKRERKTKGEVYKSVLLYHGNRATSTLTSTFGRSSHHYRSDIEGQCDWYPVVSNAVVVVDLRLGCSAAMKTSVSSTLKICVPLVEQMTDVEACFLQSTPLPHFHLWAIRAWLQHQRHWEVQRSERQHARTLSFSRRSLCRLDNEA